MEDLKKGLGKAGREVVLESEQVCGAVSKAF